MTGKAPAGSYISRRALAELRAELGHDQSAPPEPTPEERAEAARLIAAIEKVLEDFLEDFPNE